MTSSAPNPDTHGSLSPDTLHDPGPARIEAMPEILQLEKLDQLVGIYSDMLAAPRFAKESGPDLEAIERQIIEAKHRLLEDAGFVVDGNDRSEEETDMYEFAEKVLDTAIRSDKKDWMGHTTAEGGHDGLRNQIFRELLGKYYKPRRAIVDDELPPIDSDERQMQLDKYKHDLEEIRQTYSKQLAERSKKMGLFEWPRTITEMATVREEMADYIGALATEMMDDFEAQNIPKDVWIDKIDAFIEAEMSAMVGGMEAARADDFRNRSKVVRFGLEKWASWAVPTVERREGESRARHFGRSVLATMTNTNTWKKAGVFAAFGGTVGLVATPLFGFALGGMAIAGGATLVSKQIARSLVGAKLDSAAGDGTLARQHAEDMIAKMSEISGATHGDMLRLAEEMAGEYRKHNRNRLLAGMAISVAAGSTVGGLIHQFVDFNAVYGKVGEMVKGIFNRGGMSPSAPSRPSSGPNLDNPNLGGNGGKGDVPETPEPLPPAEPEPDLSRGEIIQDYIAERGAAQKIRPGEGLFQTLKELGVPAEHRREFMEKYGEKLIKKFPQAFYRMPNGETGILMTENGKMPRKALEYMVSKADKSNWIELPEPSMATAEQVSFHEGISSETTAAEQLSVSGVPTEVAAERLIANSEVVPANSVGSRGEYLMTTLEELRRAGVIDVSQDQHYGLMRQVGPRLWNLRYDDGTPVASIGRFGRWYLNSSPDGRLHPQAIREIERYVRQSSYGLAA